MCPFCISTLGLVVASAVSTGGLATLAVKLSRKKSDSTQIIPNANDLNVNEGSSQNVN
jgi:hypothetical protein